jgi:transposase
LWPRNKQLNQKLIDKVKTPAGVKGYVTNLDIPDEQVIAYYQQLFLVEATFRMAKSDLRARPIFHQTRESIEAHLTLVFAALAVGKNIDYLTGISIKQFVKLLRPIRPTIVIFKGNEILAEPMIPEPISEVLKRVSPGH